MVKKVILVTAMVWSRRTNIPTQLSVTGKLCANIGWFLSNIFSYLAVPELPNFSHNTHKGCMDRQLFM